MGLAITWKVGKFIEYLWGLSAGVRKAIIAKLQIRTESDSCCVSPKLDPGQRGLNGNPHFGGPIARSIHPAASRRSNAAPEGSQRPAGRSFIEPTEQKGAVFKRFR